MLYFRINDPDMRLHHFILPIAFLLFGAAPLLRGQVLADFETPASTPGLSADGAFGVTANPDKAGINPSDSVATYHKPEGNWKWLRLHFPDTVRIRYNNTLTFKLRATTRGRIFAKFYHGSEVVIEDWCPSWHFQPAPGAWVECTMDITAAMGKRFTRLDLAACVDNSAEADVWFDDIRLSNPEAGDGTPVLDFSVSDLKPVTGQETTFDAGKSYDFDGELVEYLWAFGNGDTLYGPLVQYGYPSDGVFTVTLTITDNDGKTATGTERIFVIDPSDVISEPVFLTENALTNQKIEAIFQAREDYGNPYDPDEVMVDAVVRLSDGDSALVPCFYYVPVAHTGDEWVADPDHSSWMVRFMSPQPGLHGVRFRVTDLSGTWWSADYPVTVHPGTARGVIREDPGNRQYFRHSTGEPFYPMGINIGWNSIGNYTKILNNLSAGGANSFRYWHTPFAWQALEWSEDYYYNYGGPGIYNQEAAAMSDSLLELCDSLDMYMQLCIFQHGMFSENVDEMWESNPYNIANGGYVERAEEYFYSPQCRDQTRKLLRYLVARWSYSRNLFAWEFFNEVQFTGIHNQQSARWFPAVADWHSEMSRYIESIDPQDHLQTTSAAEDQLDDLDSIASLDNLQYHLYEEEDNLLGKQIQLDRRFRNELEHASVINGEYGTRSGADTPFDMQRNAIWNGIMTGVPRYMWIWSHYTDPLWAGLFSMPADYLQEEDLARQRNLGEKSIPVNWPGGSLRSMGMASDSAVYGYVYDPSGSQAVGGATVSLSGLPVGNYRITWYQPVQGEVTRVDSIPVIRDSHVLHLPLFSGSLAYKVKFQAPYMLPLARAGNDTVVAVGTPARLSGRLSSSPVTDSLAYFWKLGEKPAGSQVTLTGHTSMEITLTPDLAGKYRLILTVADSARSSVPDTVEVRGSLPPVAIAPPDTTVSHTEMYVRLDGSASYDPDGDELFYSWTLLVAPQESEGLVYETDAREVILRTDAAGIYLLQLVVGDGVSLSEPDTVQVTVQGKSTGSFQSSRPPSFSVYPNPSGGTLWITLDDHTPASGIELTDTSGRLLWRSAGPHHGGERIAIQPADQARDAGPLILRVSFGDLGTTSRIILLE